MSKNPDRRRFNGPESSIPIVWVDDEDEASKKDDEREDGRGDGDVRPIYMKLGLVTQANGSCYIETGRTKLICAVYGPKPVPRSAPYSSTATLSVSLRFSPFSVPNRSLPPGPTCDSPSLSSAIHRALLPSLRLDLLPRSAIEVFVTVIEWDAADPFAGPSSGGGEATAVTACSAALASAGIEMYGLVVGVAAAMWSPAIKGAVSPGRILLDPTLDETSSSSSSKGGPEAFLSVATMPALGTTTSLSVQTASQRSSEAVTGAGWGGFSVDATEATARRCAETGALIHGVVVKALREFEEERAAEEAGERMVEG